MKHKFIPVVLLFSFAYCFVSLYSLTTVMTIQGMPSASISRYTVLYYFGYIISQIPGGLIADRIGARKLLLFSIIVNGISLIMIALCSEIFTFIFRVIGGLACGPVMACSAKIIASACPDSEVKTKWLGIMLAAPPAGLLISNAVIPFLLKILISSNLVISFVGLLSAVLCICVLAIVEKDRASEGNVSTPIEAVSTFIKDRRQLMIALSGFLFMFVNIGFGTWGRGFLDLEIGAEHTNSLMSVFCIASILGSVFSSSVSRKLSLGHRMFLAGALLSIASCYVMLSVIWPSLMLYFIILPIMGFVSYLPSAHYTSLAIDLAPAGMKASASSIQNFFLQLGAFVMSPVTSAIMDISSYTFVWIFYAFFICISALLAFLSKA